MNTFLAHMSNPARMFLIIAAPVLAHLLVIAVRRTGNRLIRAMPQSSFAKARTITGLLTSIVIFALYFVAVGLVLKEFGVSLTAYLASASVLGLAVGFGSQGLVQDVVTGLTLIFSDLVDIGDMVEISGQTGIAESIGMRFTVIKNHLGAEVHIPNRTISNVINYPRGYVRCLVDVTLSHEPDAAKRMTEKLQTIVDTAYEQFPGIFITAPSFEGIIKTSRGKAFLRIKFRIWPGRGGLLETTLKEEIVASLKELDSNYSEWMVAVNYEVEKKEIALAFRDFPQKKQ